MKYSKLTVALAALTLAAASPAVLAQSPSKDAPSGKQASQPQKKLGGMAKQDHQYFREIAQASMAEVEAGKLAQQQAGADEVKKYAEEMVQDHGKMMQEQERLAQSKGVPMPKEPKKEHQSALKKLQKAQGEQFDRAYMSQMVQDHEKALKTVKEAAQKAKDPELKAMAQKAQPDIERHLQMARQISDQASAGASGKGGRSSKSGK